MLELLRDKLPFAVDDNFLSEAVQDCLLLYLHEADLYYLQPDGQKVALATAETFTPSSSFYNRYNPPQVELKTKIKNRYPFNGIHRQLTVDLLKLADICQRYASERKLFLLVDEQIPGNTVIHFNLMPAEQWQISCLNIASNSHCLYFECDLARQSKLHIDCLSLTTLHSLKALKESLPATAVVSGSLRAEQGFVIYADLAKDAVFTSTSCNFKASSLNDAVIHLNDEGAEAEAYAAMFVNNKDSQSTHLEIRHHAPHTTSFMLCNGVIQAASTGEFVGRGYIDKAAHGTNCRQESRFLTLDKTAKAKTYPLLIIDEYDVVAGHATSVGQLNPEALYYMQSRGLTADLAKKLMTRGFLIPVVDHFRQPFLQKLGVRLLEWQTDFTADSDADLTEEELAQLENLAHSDSQHRITGNEDRILASKDTN